MQAEIGGKVFRSMARYGIEIEWKKVGKMKEAEVWVHADFK